MWQSCIFSGSPLGTLALFSFASRNSCDVPSAPASGSQVPHATLTPVAGLRHSPRSAPWSAPPRRRRGRRREEASPTEPVMSNGNPLSPPSLFSAGRSDPPLITHGCPDAMPFQSSSLYSTLHYTEKKKSSKRYNFYNSCCNGGERTKGKVCVNCPPSSVLWRCSFAFTLRILVDGSKVCEDCVMNVYFNDHSDLFW